MKFENNCGNCLNTRMCKTFEILRENDIIDDEGDFVCGFYQRNIFKIFKEEYYHYTPIPSIPEPFITTEPFITNIKDSITPYTVTYADTKELIKNDN